MTHANNINISSVISMLLTGKASKQTRVKYKLNIHSITVLLGCYILSLSKDKYTLYNILYLIGYYNTHKLRYYLGKLISNDLLTFSGRHYSLTSEGYQVINDICIQYDNVIYQFCNKYNIDL